MVNDAKLNEEEDRKNAERISARNEFEGMIYSLRNNKDNFPEETQKRIEDKVSEFQNWLDNNMGATLEEINSQKEEFTNFVSTLQPSSSETSQGTPQEETQGTPRGESQGTSQGETTSQPKIEEVD